MINAVYITLLFGGHCKYLKHEDHKFESCNCKLTASSKVEASRGVRVMLTLLLARKEKNSFKNPAFRMTSLMPGLQIVTAGKSTYTEPYNMS